MTGAANPTPPVVGTTTTGGLRGTLVGAAEFVSQIPARSLDGMALGKAAGPGTAFLCCFPAGGTAPQRTEAYVGEMTYASVAVKAGKRAPAAVRYAPAAAFAAMSVRWCEPSNEILSTAR